MVALKDIICQWETICFELSTNMASQEEQQIWTIIEKVWRHGNLLNASAQIK